MKILSLILSLSLVSCATRAPKSYKQQCADKGMILRGVSSTSGSTSNYNYYTGNNIGSFDGESVSCAVPETKRDECRVEKLRVAAGPVNEYNDGYGAKVFLSGLGYYAFVIPGVVAKLAYDSQRDSAVNKSYELEALAEKECSITQEERVPASN